MTNEYYGAASTPNEDFLAHYGVKGMKWGVRKARESGNARRLGRQFNKAQKKLAKLEKRAASGKKYAKRAAALGLGAAAAGGVAATGTRGISDVTRFGTRATRAALEAGGTGMQTVGKAMKRLGIRGGGRMTNAGTAVRSAAGRVGLAGMKAGNAIEKWGKSNSIGKGLQDNAARAANAAYRLKHPNVGGNYFVAQNARNKVAGISNSGYTRLAAAGLGAGLAGAAGYNAYRAATTKRAAKKAAQFRSEMNKAFAGTKYANQVASSGYKPKQKKRRRRG